MRNSVLKRHQHLKSSGTRLKKQFDVTVDCTLHSVHVQENSSIRVHRNSGEFINLHPLGFLAVAVIEVASKCLPRSFAHYNTYRVAPKCKPLSFVTKSSNADDSQYYFADTN